MNKRQKRTGKKKPEQPAMRSRTIFLNEPPKKGHHYAQIYS